MSIAIYGIGWIGSSGFGTVATGRRHPFGPEETVHTTPREGLFRRPIKNFGRLDRASRITVAAASLALQDAGIDASPASKQDIGIVGTNGDGCLWTDQDYFRDYLENGRTLARANLFIYTLPSSPLGEAAIHFGLTGPLLYTLDSAGSPVSALRTAAGLIADGGTERMLAGATADDQAIYLLLARHGSQPLCTVEEAAGILGQDLALDMLAERFSMCAP